MSIRISSEREQQTCNFSLFFNYRHCLLHWSLQINQIKNHILNTKHFVSPFQIYINLQTLSTPGHTCQPLSTTFPFSSTHFSSFTIMKLPCSLLDNFSCSLRILSPTCLEVWSFSEVSWYLYIVYSHPSTIKAMKTVLMAPVFRVIVPCIWCDYFHLGPRWHVTSCMHQNKYGDVSKYWIVGSFYLFAR